MWCLQFTMYQVLYIYTNKHTYMSNPIATYEPTNTSMFDWHHEDIINSPVYEHYDMVVALAQGQFIIEGKESDIHDALMYAEFHHGEPDVWKALDDVEHDTIVSLVY